MNHTEPAPVLTPQATDTPWVVLIVDDDPDVHAVTRMALTGFRFEGRALEFLSAYTGAEGRTVLESRADVAMVLLDVVMETDQAGLQLAQEIRGALHNHAIRIVLRTGQAGQAPPLSVIENYEVDDYRTKTELTFERLTILVKSALRTYRRLRELDDQRRALEQHNEALRRRCDCADGGATPTPA